MYEQSTDVPPISKTAVSRRTFMGLTLGLLSSLLAACRPTGRADSVTRQQSTTAPATATPTASVGSRARMPSPTAADALPTATEAVSPPTSTPASAPSHPTAPSTATAQLATATPVPPTYSPVPATPTEPPSPTEIPQPKLKRADLMAHWPASANSRVVVVRHGGVWSENAPDPSVVLQMLDAGLGALTGVGDVLAVWRTLFAPHERVLLKVNCIAYGGPTQPAVSFAVAQRLQDAGLQAGNLLIFDRTDHELAGAGYTVNDGGPGVQCHGSRGNGSEVSLSQSRVSFYSDLDACDAIVNLPIPKQHSMAGVSVALKNHYGSIAQPGRLHGSRCDPAIAELNAQPNIRDKTRLVVGAALEVSPGDWNNPERENALLLSFDPVALDTVARDILVRHRQDMGMDTRLLTEGARHLHTAQSLGLGATEADLIDLREVTLG